MCVCVPILTHSAPGGCCCGSAGNYLCISYVCVCVCVCVCMCVYPCTPIPHQGVAAVALQVTTCALATRVCVFTHTVYPYKPFRTSYPCVSVCGCVVYVCEVLCMCVRACVYAVVLCCVFVCVGGGGGIVCVYICVRARMHACAVVLRVSMCMHF